MEGYLKVASPLWMWEDAIAERLVEVQEFWLAKRFLRAETNGEPHYGVIFGQWHHLMLEVRQSWRVTEKPL